MTKRINIKNLLIIISFPLLMISLMTFLVNSSFFESNPKSLTIAITADLLFTMPLIHFLLIRKSKIPKFTIVSLFIIGLFVSSFILPKEDQFLVRTIKNWVLPFVEIGIAFFIISKVRSTLKKFKENQHLSSDFFTVLKETSAEILP